MEILKNNEPGSSLSHLLGMLLSVEALVLMLVAAQRYGNAWHTVAFSIFGSSLILLYLASAVYHAISKNSRLKTLFRRIDLSFIFILIAGTYTPVALLALPGAWGWTAFGLAWAIAGFGVLLHIFKVRLKTGPALLLYLSMGWMLILFLPRLFGVLSPAGIFWLVAGGLFYTLGVLFFALGRKIKMHRWFGMHEIFHILVMAGSFCHFWLMNSHLVFLK